MYGIYMIYCMFKIFYCIIYMYITASGEPKNVICIVTLKSRYTSSKVT